MTGTWRGRDGRGELWCMEVGGEGLGLGESCEKGGLV